MKSFDQNIQGKFTYLPKHVLKGQMTLIDSGLQSNMFNIVFCNPNVEPIAVHQAIEYFREKKLPYAFWIGFDADPLWLEQELIAKGLTSEETEWAMVCDLDQHPPEVADFDIRQVQTQEGIQDVISVMNGILPSEEHEAIQTFYEQSQDKLLAEGSRLTFFVGYENERPISISSCFCDENEASVFDVIVLPEMRGKGLGKAMTCQAMLQAKEKGYNRCILTATNDVKYLYQKLGFKDLKTMKVFV